MARRRFVITYDVVADKRRAKIHAALLDYGDWVQYSVFVCDLDDRERVKLRARLETLVNHGEDQVLTIDLGPAERELDQVISALGRGFELPVRALVV